MKKFSLFILSVLFLTNIHAQMGMMGGGGGYKGPTNVGHFYGKVIDSLTGKPIPFAAVQLSGPKWDSVSQSMKSAVIAGQLTGDNGEFSLEKLPVMGPFTIEIATIGYKTYTKTVGFNLSKLMKNAQKMKSQSGDASDPSAMASSVENMVNAVDKDLGNIRLSPDATQLQAVTVDGSAPPMELKLDKKVFDVSKSITTTGGTAEDVLKNIPAVNVDIDGNVTLRNSSPTIYVDGMPTNMTIDQIPADEIDKIEVITNPSAKYDAAASSGGIINIVMKKNRQVGYNGDLRGGIDEYGKWNGGLDLNVRKNKINVFGSLFYHQAHHIMDGLTIRNNTAGMSPLTDVTQNDTNTMDGYFAFVRGGVDYFMDNRNTFTLSGSYGRGDFNTGDLLHTLTDTLHTPAPVTSSTEFRNSNSERTFTHEGAQLLYKHLFPKEGEDLSADVSVDDGISNGSSNYSSQYYGMNNNMLGTPILQQQQTSGTNNTYVAKADFSDPLSTKVKIETGLMGTLNQVNSSTNNYIYNVEEPKLNTDYTFNQEIYAGYFTLSQDVSSRLSYQAGLRAESSFYTGQYVDSSKSFTNQYPISLFPSAYITYHISDKSDLQINYSRHITRPSFFQLVPYIDYSDSLNLKQGNPNLQPEFINSFEVNYLNNFNKKNTFLFGLYYKDITGLITAYQEYEYNSFLNKDVVINTFENANSANSYGADITSQNSIGNWLDITSNVNLYESSINGNNLGSNLNEQLLSWFGKLNLTFRLPKQFSIQAIGSYQSKSIIPISQGGGRWGNYGLSSTPTSQGYILPIYSVDLAIKKDFLKSKALSVTVNVKDIFATSVTGTTSNTDFFTQTTSRKRDQQFVRLTISYRFGQTDFSLFKKKNMDMPAQSQDVQGGGDQ